MSPLRTVPLGEVASASGSKAGERTDLPVYSVTKHTGFVPSAEYFNKQVFSRDLSGYKFVRAGEFAYATIHLDEGSIGIAPVDSLISPMYTVFAIDESLVDPSYLVRYLKSPRAIAEYPMLGTGSAERRKSIPFARLKGMEIPLPPIGEQRRIAAILDHADALRAKRREALARLDELTQSIFIDMFGDPVANDRDWPAGVVGDFVDRFEGGKNIVGAGDSPDGFRVLKVSAVTSLSYRESESKPLPEGYVPPSSHMVQTGDLLFSRANTSELVGATALVADTKGRTALPDKLWRFKWKDESAVAPGYVAALFQRPSFRRKVSDRATGSSGSMKNISQGKVLSIPVGLPPVELQMDFESLRVGVDSMKRDHRAALAELDALSASLQARAFLGEL